MGFLTFTINWESPNVNEITLGKYLPNEWLMTSDSETG